MDFLKKRPITGAAAVRGNKDFLNLSILAFASDGGPAMPKAERTGAPPYRSWIGKARIGTGESESGDHRTRTLLTR